MTTTHREELILAALRELKDHGATPDSASVQSIVAASSPADNVQVLMRDVFAPDGAVLELHLDGPGVTDHHTRATHFSLFVRHLAEATKEIAKHATDRTRMGADLQIAPVFAGSVGVRLIVPEEPEAYGTGKMVDVAEAESDALRRVGALISAASDDDLSQDLATFIEPLPAAARTALRGASRQQVLARWDISGEVTQPGQETVRVVSSRRGATRLWSELERVDQRSEIVVRGGYIDGYKHSLRAMWFHDEDGKSYKLAVPDADLMLQVAHLASDPDQYVSITFAMTAKVPPGDESGVTYARTLQLIEALDGPSRPQAGVVAPPVDNPELPI